MVKVIRSVMGRPLLAVFVAVATVVALPVAAQMPPPMPMGPAMHGGMEGMPGMGHMGGRPGQMGRKIDGMLDGLGASDAQRMQIKQIAATAAADMMAQRAAARGMRMRAMQIFTAPTIDAGAAEQLRQQMLAQHDQMSRRMTQAMIDVAKVLTPEQRAKIGERMRDRQGRMDERRQRMERAKPPAK